VQAIKAGVLEIADLLVVNRGDSPLAPDTERSLREMLRLRRRGPWEVRVLRTTATTGEGVPALVDAIEEHGAFAGRGRRLRTPVPATIDDVAAVDRAITSRRSVRAFLPRPVPRATVEEILAVASRAPSGTNTQPWRVRVLAGEAKDRLSRAVAAAYDAGDAHREFDYYPTKWFEPYLARRRKIGWDLYGLLGIARGEKAKMHAQHRRNFLFFGAPVGMIFTIERGLELGSWLDYGMFLQNIMVAARARGLDTCPQAAWMEFPKTIAAELALPANEQVVCGMSLGYADPDAPENRLVTEREPVPGFARFEGFE
jgi:nitroreductase